MSLVNELMNIFSRHRNRWIYFLILTIFGGLGSWITGFQYLHDSVRTTGYQFLAGLGTFSISIAVMSIMDYFVLSLSDKRLFRDLLLMGTFLFSAFLGCLSLVEFQNWLYTALVAWLSLMLAWATWWQTHCWNPALDYNDAYSTLGGTV